jgi:hypothetical protein
MARVDPVGVPAFLFSVFVFYWSLPIFASVYRIRFASRGRRNDMLDWCGVQRTLASPARARPPQPAAVFR